MRELILVMMLAVASCGGDDDPPAIDAMPAAPDAPASICGEVGDLGNELGVGQYCDFTADCTGSEAVLCATLGNPQAHFCTMVCDMADPTFDCGADAACQCQEGACACTPNSCL